MTVTLYKDRIECAMPARLMLAIVVQDVFVVVDDKNGPETVDKMRELLKFACLQPLEGLSNKVRLVAAKQLDRVHAKVMDEYDQQRADKVATAIFYFLKEITDSGYLELWEGSPVAEAVGMYIPMIEHVFGIEKLDEAAQKQGRRILSKLQLMGYYI